MWDEIQLVSFQTTRRSNSLVESNLHTSFLSAYVWLSVSKIYYNLGLLNGTVWVEQALKFWEDFPYEINFWLVCLGWPCSSSHINSWPRWVIFASTGSPGCRNYQSRFWCHWSRTRCQWLGRFCWTGCFHCVFIREKCPMEVGTKTKHLSLKFLAKVYSPNKFWCFLNISFYFWGICWLS